VRRAWMLLVTALAVVGPAPAGAQKAPSLTVRVRQVAGGSLYLDVGTRNGLATGDTLTVARDSSNAPMGRLVVTASTEVRAVLAEAGEPFPVAAGDHLVLFLLRAPVEVPAEESVQPATPRAPSAGAGKGDRAAVDAEAAPPPVPRAVPAPHGRVGLDMSAVRSVTQVGGEEPLDVDRTFATPALRFDVTAPEAVGGFTLRTSARFAYRYSSTDALQPAASARIYAASLERDFTAVPLRVTLGRFYSPAESYSGFWDGALVRVGGNALGVGVLVGFEPDRYDEHPSLQSPKGSAFLEWRTRGTGWRWTGDLSAHTVRPVDSVPAHTFMGASQRITLGPIRLSHDLQLDRDPAGGPWRVSRLRAGASLDVTAAVELRAGVARREAYLPGRLDGPFFSSRSDRVDAGVGVRTDGGYASADVDISRDASGNETWGTTAFFAAYGLPGLGFAGLAGSVGRWSGPYGSTLSASPGLTLELEPVSLRFEYRFARSDYLARRVDTHGVDASLDAPFGPAMRISARARVQWGGLLRNQGLDLTLYRIF
jgi:hypothetical protein